MSQTAHMSTGIDPTTELSDAPKALGALRRELSRLDSVVVAFSGGVDSAVLAHVALEVLGPERTLAVTARSASLAAGEIDHCRGLAEAWGLPWRSVDTTEMDDPRYVANDGDRCRWCKSALMDALDPVAVANGSVVVLGVNTDDLSDHRPGQEAARERGARFPMVDAALSKADVRAVARHRGLTVWDRPAMPCLSSRLPYGTPVTVELLGRVDRAESALRGLGFSDLRVRHHGDTARVEVPADELVLAAGRADEIVELLVSVGYRYVTLDLAGLRSGNLNAALGSGRRGSG